jgi:hypothetical protein
MSYHGDIRLEDTIDIPFTTVSTTGAPTTLAGTPVVSAYVGNSTTQLTAGITLSVDFDGVTGFHNVRVAATAANGYTAPTNVSLVITTGTVGGTSVVGYKVGSFSIEARSAVMPTTAARKLDVSAGGEAGIDWANIVSPTTAQNLSGTNIDVDQIVASVSGAVGSVTGAVGSVTGHTPQTGDAYAIVNSGTHGNAALKTLIDAVDDFLDTEVAAILAAVDTEVAAILAAVDTEVAAIKAKTDSLTFTKALELDVNLQSINGTTVNGDGGATPWGP